MKTIALVLALAFAVPAIVLAANTHKPHKVKRHKYKRHRAVRHS